MKPYCRVPRLFQPWVSSPTRLKQPWHTRRPRPVGSDPRAALRL